MEHDIEDTIINFPEDSVLDETESNESLNSIKSDSELYSLYDRFDKILLGVTCDYKVDNKYMGIFSIEEKPMLDLTRLYNRFAYGYSIINFNILSISCATIRDPGIDSQIRRTIEMLIANGEDNYSFLPDCFINSMDFTSYIEELSRYFGAEVFRNYYMDMIDRLKCNIDLCKSIDDYESYTRISNTLNGGLIYEIFVNTVESDKWKDLDSEHNISPSNVINFKIAFFQFIGKAIVDSIDILVKCVKRDIENNGVASSSYYMNHIFKMEEELRRILKYSIFGFDVSLSKILVNIDEKMKEFILLNGENKIPPIIPLNYVEARDRMLDEFAADTITSFLEVVMDKFMMRATCIRLGLLAKTIQSMDYLIEVKDLLYMIREEYEWSAENSEPGRLCMDELERMIYLEETMMDVISR
jgi:hypothetical protein